MSAPPTLKAPPSFSATLFEKIQLLKVGLASPAYKAPPLLPFNAWFPVKLQPIKVAVFPSPIKTAPPLPLAAILFLSCVFRTKQSPDRAARYKPPPLASFEILFSSMQLSILREVKFPPNTRPAPALPPVFSQCLITTPVKLTCVELPSIKMPPPEPFQEVGSDVSFPFCIVNCSMITAAPPEI